MFSSHVLDQVGNTPVVRLRIKEQPQLNVVCKLEYYNPTGSVKDRAASYILEKCLKDKIIDKDTTIIESSSGNFGVALAAYCKRLNLKFICVIDPNISFINEMLIKSLGGITYKMDKPDINGGYLITRIQKVKELTREIKNSYWINQYSNVLNARAYYGSLGQEICDEFDDNLDYVFMGVSSGGTITGASQRVKEKFPNAQIIAVDIEGSVIFGGHASKRYIPGIGSSMVPEILKDAYIDDVVWVNELDVVDHCRELLTEYSIFAGGSSGSVYAAIKKYFSIRKLDQKVNVLCVFPDRGERYCSTIYSDTWRERFFRLAATTIKEP